MGKFDECRPTDGNNKKIGQLYFYAYVCLQEYESVFLMIAKIFL